MHRLPLVLLALALVLPAMPLQVQGLSSSTANPTAIAILQDSAGDVRADAGGTGSTNPTPRFGQLDLLAAGALEGPTEVTFTLQVASLDPTTEPPLAESAFYSLNFLQGDVHYALQLGRVKSQETGVWGILSRYDPALNRHYAIDYVPVTADAAAATFTAIVPRDFLVDSHGARPYPGTALTGFWADSQSFVEIFTSITAFAGAEPLTIRDRMPDVDKGTVPVPILLGPAQTGSARLSSQLPTRQSNGEATTFLFTVEARNIGDRDDRYRLSTGPLPPGWKVTLQDDLVPLSPGGGLSFPVLLTVPFAHEHGTFKSFMLRLESATDPASHADLELGVRYPKVPQPAGHHSTLFLHGAKWTTDPTVTVWATVFAFNTEYAWMNALDRDPGDEKVPVPADGRFNLVPPVPGTFRWTVPLGPDLAIGLDFDLTRTGLFAGSFEANSPLAQASLSGELVLYVDSRYDEFGTRIGGNRTVLARLVPSPAQDVMPGAQAGYSVEVRPTPESELVPFAQRSSLVLELNLTGMRPDTAEARDPPRLRPDATLALPLWEFHDPVDSVFAATSRLSIQATGAQDRHVNPGETAVFNLEVRLGPDAGDHTIQLDLSGEGAAWARLLEPQQRQMAAGEAWTVPVAVAVPQDAKPLQTADLIVRAQAEDDQGLRALVRLYATVTTGQDLPDEADLAASLDNTQEKESPAVGPLVTLLLLGMAFPASRRLRRLA